MLNLKTLIENHEDWLTDRVVQYAQLNSYTLYTSTLREAWRISICGLSVPLVQMIGAAQSSKIPRETAINNATEFGVSQGLKHRSLGIELGDFIGMLKLYRKAYVDLLTEMEPPSDTRSTLQDLIFELFDSIEVGVMTAWSASNATDQLGELQKRNRELSNEKNKYLTVFESIAEPAILLNPDDKPTHVNAAANCLLLGETKPGAGYYGTLDNPLLHALVAKILNSGGDGPDPVTLVTPGGVRLFNVSIRQMLDISKKFAGQIIILQDVTDYLHAIDAAQAADRAKSVFLTTLSHEIRTPINSILGLSRLLEDEDRPTPKLKRLRSIRASGEMLSALIENVLGMSKAETNALQLVEQDFDLTELCQALFQVLELEEINQQLALEKRFDPDVPQRLHGDGHKLRHVLLNLLSNALKYTERGTVTLAVSVEGPKAEDGVRDRDKTGTEKENGKGKGNGPTLRFEVVDTGIGVPADEVAGLFEPFFQGAHSNIATVARGSGLGLAICKHLVEFLGGGITYRPNPAGGSIFGFSLRFDEAKKPSRQSKDAAGHTVLVVEDDQVNAIVIEGYLRELGNVVTVVKSYQAAVDALERAEFDIVVTDYKLDGKTGLDVAHEVRRVGRQKGKTIPVVVVTAAIPQDASHRLRQSDVSLFLEKPFSRYELANALSSVSHARGRVLETPPAEASAHVSVKDLNRLLSDLGFTRCQAVIRSYQSNMPSLISGMRARLNDDDLPGVSELAHRLISASGFVGAWPLVRLTNDLKALCKTADREAVDAKYIELLRESELAGQDLDTCWSRIEASHLG